jgi:hypothetical protein
MLIIKFIEAPTPFQLLNHQLIHYTKRLTEARTQEEKSFIRKQLSGLKKSATNR